MVMSFSPIKKSAFYHLQAAMGAKMVERDGWLQPGCYLSPDQESRVVAESVGVCDVSPSGKLLLQDDDLGDHLTGLVPADNAPAVGKVGKVSLPARGNLARVTDDECLLLCEAVDIPKWTSLLIDGLAGRVHLVDQTSGLSGTRLTGPTSPGLLCKLSELDTSHDAFPDLSCAQARFAEIHGTLIRTDLGPLPSYELLFPREFGEYMWDAIFEAGEEFGVVPVGLEAAARLQAQFETDPTMTTT